MGGTRELDGGETARLRVEGGLRESRGTEGGRYESGRSQLGHKSYTLLHGRGDKKKSRFRDATSPSLLFQRRFKKLIILGRSFFLPSKKKKKKEGGNFSLTGPSL